MISSLVTKKGGSNAVHSRSSFRLEDRDEQASDRSTAAHEHFFPLLEPRAFDRVDRDRERLGHRARLERDRVGKLVQVVLGAVTEVVFREAPSEVCRGRETHEPQFGAR